MDSFDAYHQWLGIPPEDQPPHHYRLLGLKAFEDNPTVISHAADRQMSHLRTFQTGPHGATSQQLLNEVAGARVCLLHAEKKAAYDEWLRQAMAKTRSADSPSWSNAAADPKLAKLLDHVEADQSETRSRAAATRQEARNRLGVVLLSLGLLAVVGLMSWGFLFSGDPPAKRTGPRKTARSSQPQQAPQHKTTALPGPVGGSAQDTNSNTPKATDPANEPASENRALPPDNGLPGGSNSATTADSTLPEVKVEPPKVDTPPIVVEPSAAATAESDQTSAAAPNASQGEAKHRVPSADAQRRTVKTLDEIYTFSKDRTPEETDKLIEELLEHGRKLDGTPEERYVVLHRAAEMACQAGRMDKMLQTVETLGRHYEVDPWDLRHDMLKQMAALIKEPDAAQSFLSSLEGVLDEALELQRFDVAEKLAKIGYRASTQATSSALRKQWRESSTAISRLAKRAKRVEEAQHRLATSPGDADANLLVGRWYCFEQDNWKTGLPYLVKGSDRHLSDLAKLELQQNPIGPHDQVRLADAWWEWLNNAKRCEREAIRRHAADWYHRVEPQLSGVAKLKVTKRLESLAQSAGTGDEDQGRGAATSDSDDSTMERYRIVRRGRTYRCQIAACCDDQFEMYVNGQLLMKSVKTLEVTHRVEMLAKGDIITVLAVDTGGVRGFACAILSDRGGLVLTGPTWRSYQPKSPDTWYLPDQIGQMAPVATADVSVAKRFQEKTRIQAASIWNKDQSQQCYLSFQIP
ncbi:MAG: hypothetical protein JW888_06965 [Pirellulales bacterium]|nr:hypothetical protein [Pirellulales bacterium]